MFLSYAVMLNSGLLNEFIQAVIPFEAAAQDPSAGEPRLAATTCPPHFDLTILDASLKTGLWMHGGAVNYTYCVANRGKPTPVSATSSAPR
jgi:hypothetical protein